MVRSQITESKFLFFISFMGRKEEVKTNEMLPSVYGKPQITGSITKTFTSGSITFLKRPKENELLSFRRAF